MLAPAGADKRGPKAPFPLVEMQEYSRQFAREYPPALRREPGLIESTAWFLSLELMYKLLSQFFFLVVGLPLMYPRSGACLPLSIICSRFTSRYYSDQDLFIMLNVLFSVVFSGTSFCCIVVLLEYLYYVCHSSSSTWTFSSQINFLNVTP